MTRLANGEALAWLREAVTRETDDCVLWPFSTQRGYAVFGRRQAGGTLPRRASRAAWMLIHGALADDEMVLHRCDNPMCVNVRHLFLGNAGDNARDRSAKGRSRHTEWQKAKTHCPQGHLYDETNTMLDKYGNRSCRTCHRERERARRAALRAARAQIPQGES